MFTNQHAQTEIYGLTPGHANLVDIDISPFFHFQPPSARVGPGFLGRAGI